jgi:hypothetical protein
MHTFLLARRATLQSHDGGSRKESHPDLPVAVVVKRAIEEGMRVQGVVLANESYIYRRHRSVSSQSPKERSSSGEAIFSVHGIAVATRSQT